MRTRELQNCSAGADQLPSPGAEALSKAGANLVEFGVVCSYGTAAAEFLD